MSNRATKSHVVVVSDQKHPMHHLALHLVKHSDVAKSIVERTREFALDQQLVKTPTLYDHAALMEHVKSNGDYAAMFNIFKQALKKEPKDLAKDHSSYPKPPTACELYGRIKKDAEILDVGSGDAKRLIQFDGQLVLNTIDCEVEKSGVRVASNHTFGKFETPSDLVVTSFNAMTNNKDVSAFEGSDGIHVIPDLVELQKAGLTKEFKDGRCVTAVQGKTYTDYINDIPSTRLRNFYRGVNTYAKRICYLKATGKEYDTGIALKSEGRRVTCMPSGDVEFTEKLDGELHRLVVRKPRAGVKLHAYMLDRGGRCYEYSNNCDVDMALKLEKVGKQWYLLAVDNYRDYVPFHDYNLLEYFLKRVKLMIDDVFVKVPPRWDGSMNVEGVVFRSMGSDWLFRTHHSFDVTHAQVKILLDEIEAAGYGRYDIDVPDDGCIYEIMLARERTDYCLILMGKRNKLTFTTEREIRNMLKWPTLLDWAEHHGHIPCEYSNIHTVSQDVDDSDNEEY